MEIWKDIEGYEGFYQVSNLGRVKSLKCGKERILKQYLNTHGYCQVSLSKKNTKPIKRVHQLVAQTFLNYKPCRIKKVVDHINDIKTDNRLDNLQVVTQRFNCCKTQGRYSSKYKGVSWHSTNKSWRAKITINGKKKDLGCFKIEEEARDAYQNALKKLL